MSINNSFKSLYSLIIFIFLLLSTSNCLDSIRFRNRKDKLPLPAQMESSYCQTGDNLSYVAYIIRSHIGDKSWAKFHKPLLHSQKLEEQIKSQRVRKARVIFARCAQLLYDAVATGSARDLTAIIEKDATLVDIDMSVPFQNLNQAEKWLKDYIPNAEKSLEMAFLLNPIENLACRNNQDRALYQCVHKDVLSTSQLLILLERKQQNQDHLNQEFQAICPTEIITPKTTPLFQSLFAVKTENDFSEFLLSQQIKKDNPQAGRYYALYLGLQNSAYYLQSGSIRRWVVERESVFLNKMNKAHPNYLKNQQMKKIQAEGAIIEQFLRSNHRKNSFYYKYKYLFRAASHAGYDIEKKLPIFAAIHKVSKIHRPKTFSETLAGLNQSLKQSIHKKYPALKAYRRGISAEQLKKITQTAEKKIFQAIKLFYKSRKNSPYSIWPKICRPQ